MRCKQKFLALLLAVALLLAMSSTALADGEVCKIGDTPYDTLQDAVNEVAGDSTLNNSTIILTAEAKENVTIPVGVTITLDLNGCTLNGGTTPGKAALTNYGTVTIQDSTGTGTIKREDSDDGGGYYTILNESTMTITGGKVENNSGLPAPDWSGASLICNGLTKNATLTISGGTISQNNFIAVKNDENGTLNITGGTISSKTQAVQNWCNATISGGNLTGAVTTWAYSNFDGETTISGGTIDGDVCACWFDGGGYEVQDGIIPKVTIQEGATITGNLQKETTQSTSDPASPVEADNPGGSIIVYGGTFNPDASSTITPYLASGLELVMGADGKYVVKKASSHDDDDDSSIGYPPTILSPTGNQVVAVMANGTVTLSVDATGVGFGGYQWYVNRGDGQGFVPVAGATGDSLTLYPTFADNGSQYYCRVRNGYGYVDSGYFTLSVVGGMVPKTGDQVSVTLWVCLMALGVAGAAAVLARRRSR